MSKAMQKHKILKGAEFLITPTDPSNTFFPEDFNEEQKMIADTVKDFVDNHINTNLEKIEKQENNISKDIMTAAGEMGLLSPHIPMNYGGMEMDTNTATLISEGMGPAGSFSVSYAAHTGIGMLPILYFGTEEQKMKYLPDLATGVKAASYCLTEPGSGSDALAAKTRADLSEDGSHYILNGQKMWITNAAFAEVFIVFPQVDGDKFTGFIVEKGTEGLSLGAEEDKLGIKGSSTRQVFFENAKVPIANVLGEIGKGHLIAFNVLNDGRFKLSVQATGASIKNIIKGIKYANERHQFKVPISSFGAIKHKIAEQAIRIFAAQSANYRVSNMMQNKAKDLMANGKSFAEAKLLSAEEFAVVCYC